MINSISTQNSPQSMLMQNAPRLLDSAATGFPMQNLIALAEDPLAAVASDKRISLTPQSFASIITKSIVQAMQAVITTFIDKITELIGMQKAGTSPAPEASGSTAGTTSTGSASESPGTSGTSSSSGTSGTEESGGVFDSVKDFFGKIGDFFFSGKDGVGEILMDIVTSLLPGGALKTGELLKKFKGAGKVLKNLLNLGEGALGSVVKKGKDLVGKLFKSGKSILQKIF